MFLFFLKSCVLKGIYASQLILQIIPGTLDFLLVNYTESTASNPTWKGFTKEFAEESLSSQYLSFDDDVPQPLQCKDGRETRQWSTVSAPLKRDSRWNNWCPHNGIARFTGNYLNMSATVLGTVFCSGQ